MSELLTTLRLEDFNALVGRTIDVQIDDRFVASQVLAARKVGGSSLREGGGFAVDLRLPPHAPRQGVLLTRLPQGEVGIFMSPRKIVGGEVDYEAVFN